MRSGESLDLYVVVTILIITMFICLWYFGAVPFSPNGHA